jgi:hypothetical protein
VATTPIDPAISPQWALAGRIVTMDQHASVIADGAVWVENAAIAALTTRGDDPPDRFAGIAPVETGGRSCPA